MNDIYADVNPIEKWDIFSDPVRPVIISGPCSAESEEQLFQTAARLSDVGIKYFRAGVWKPRTYPGSFEGAGAEALKWLARVKRELGMRVCTEVANASHVESALTEGIDFLWIGARSTGNPFVLQEIADSLRGVDIPVFVKNPPYPDINQWVGAIERLHIAGITSLGAIHRGFARYEKGKYRNSPDWQIAVELRRIIPEIPFFCDPSHIAGDREYIAELSQKAVDLGFDGLFIESHIDPDNALSDSSQQVTPEDLNKILNNIEIKGFVSIDSVDSELISQLRSRIDLLDDSILEILSERLDITDKIGELKNKHKLTVLQAGRWSELLKRAIKLGQQKGLDPTFIKNLMEIIHQESIRRQIR